jgi:molybdenum cofactor synthesis domain-containing protein
VAEFCLLNKRELSIDGISLQNANLNEVSTVVGETLGVERSAILVTDVQGDTLVLDILKENINANQILAKKHVLLQELSKLPGVGITLKTSVSSKGMLGWIALDQEEMRRALKRSERIAERVRQRLSKRAIVFSTGFEVASGQVKDTNTPDIEHKLKPEGYSVTLGSTLRDDELFIAANMRQAVEDGYGLVITTGGVGAEGKDHTVEAVLALDPKAATPYICKYQKGTGRHHKDGVRIAVGQVSETIIVALPGPNDEVRLSLDVLVKGLNSGLSKRMLAQSMASALRKRLQEKMNHQSDDDCNG